MHGKLPPLPYVERQLQKLTVAIITFNEEKNIERCINSVWTLADEILIVDSFSKDKTKELALKFPKVTWLENPFEGHIQQKNFALKKSKNKWVLSLDADEVLSNELRLEIEKALEEPKADGFSFNRLNNYCGHWIHHGGWYPDVKLRLVQKDNAEWRGENPHDKLEVINGKNIVHLEGDLLHYSYATYEDHFKQIEYFGNIASKAAYDKGKRTNKLSIYLKSGFQFIKGYLLKGGYRDGKIGKVIAKRSAYATYVKYTKLLELQRNGK